MLSTLLVAALTTSIPPLAITHVRVVPMDREVVLEDQTVIIADGRIAALGPSAEVAVPADATVVDGAGKWLMPGLADMHVHTWIANDLPVFVAHGVTTVRNMFGSPQQLQWKREIESGERLGPRIYTAGPIIDGDPPVWPGSTVLVDAKDAERIVLEQKEAGYDFLKVYSRLPADAFRALAAAAKQHGMRVMGHVPDSISLLDAAAAGQESFEHQTGLVEACQRDDSPFAGDVTFRNESQAWKQVDESKVAAAAKACTAAGLWSCPTLIVMQKWAKGDEAAALLAGPAMRFVSPFVKSYWRSPAMYLAKMPDEYLAQSRQADADRKRAVRIFHEAGGLLLCGTDVGNPYLVPGLSLHEELANLVSCGLTPFEALRAATADAARFLEAEGEWGTIRAGARADLLLLDADPLADVANAAKLSGVALAGRWLGAADLEAKLEEVARSYGAGPPAAEPGAAEEGKRGGG